LRDWYLMCPDAATANLMAAATALDPGTRWFGGFALDDGGASLKQSPGIPAAVEIAAVTPLGYPADDTPIRPRRPLARAELAACGRGKNWLTCGRGSPALTAGWFATARRWCG
jgi:nitroreductase